MVVWLTIVTKASEARMTSNDMKAVCIPSRKSVTGAMVAINPRMVDIASRYFIMGVTTIKNT